MNSKPATLLRRARAWLIILLAGISLQGHAQDFSVKNNLLYDATLTPNLGIEVQTGRRITYGVNAGFRPWPTDELKSRKYKHLMVAPQMRFWLDSAFHKAFVGTTIVYSHYNVADVKFPFGLYKSVQNERRQGDLVAVGISIGYSWWLGDTATWRGRHLRLEAEAGPDVGIAKYKQYDCGHCGTYRGEETKPFIMPKVAVNLAYNLAGRKRYIAEEVPEIEPLDTIEVPEPYEPDINMSIVPPDMGTAGILRKENPVLAHISDYKPYDETRILRKEKGMLYVHFPLDKTTLLYDFDNNGPVLDRIVSITRDVMADSTSSVKRIQIIGLASIEGSIKHNRQLSDGRAQALRDYVKRNVDVPDSLFDLSAGGEAWTEFRDQLNDLLENEELRTAGEKWEGNIPTEEQLREVIGIIDTEKDADRREQRLKRHATWRYIRDNVLHEQRNSGYVRIYYDYVPDTKAETINRAAEMVKEGKYLQAIELLDTVSDDPRRLNTLATACYQAGQTEKARQLWQQAADNGDEQAKKNLAELQRYLDNLRDRNNAEQWNEKLLNNR